jgi:hypothetical protein
MEAQNKSKLAVFLTLLAVALVGCKSVTNLENDPAFKPMFGKIFKTKKALVVMNYRDTPKEFVLGIPGTQDVPPIEKMPKEFPFVYFNQTTYGVLPVGSEFRIVRIARVKSIEYSFVDFYADVTSEGPFKGYRLEVGGPTDQTKPVPTFDPEYVVEASLAQ